MQLPGYQLGEKIGEGGMATVYKGQQLSLSRSVAIKVLNQHMRKHSQVSEAFDREALIIARLSHPNIIQVYDRGTTEQGAPYFIMEYVDGIDLAMLLREGQLPLGRKLELCLQVCKALSYAHQNGVIHRDIKPGNIILDSQMHAKVLDFGIALLAQDGGFSSLDGGEKDVMGTLAYMAPELNHLAGAATVRSDVYSLGVVMYELFSGHLPRNEGRPPSAYGAKLPPKLDKIVMSCIARDPLKRPPTVMALYEQLLLLLNGTHLNKQQVARAQESVKEKDFVLLDVLRENKSGAVYLFSEKHNGRRLIVKKCMGEHEGYAVGKAMAALDHKNIVKVHGASKNPRAFIVVTDYLTGGSLHERMIRPFSVAEFLVLAQQICDGLAFAHQHNIIHGNFKANNVLFDDQGYVKISDFGLPAHYSDKMQEQMVGSFRKKNWYSLPDEPASIKTDIYACGMVFYLLLAGSLPRFIDGILQKGDAFRRLPKILQVTIEKMLEKHPVDRFDKLEQVGEILDELNDDMATVVLHSQKRAKPTSTSKARRRQIRQEEKKRLLLLLLLILLFIAMVNGGIIIYFEGGFSLRPLQEWFREWVGQWF